MFYTLWNSQFCCVDLLYSGESRAVNLEGSEEILEQGEIVFSIGD